MNKYGYLKITLCLLAVFLAGSVTGGVVMLHIARAVVHVNLNPDKFSDKIVNGMAHQLSLSEEQKASFKPIVSDTTQKLRKIQLENRARVEAAISEGKEKLMPLLNDEQKKELQKMDDQRIHRQNQFYQQDLK